MYIAFYRWRLKVGREETFRALWEAGTQLFIDEQHTLGSRLHKADDGTYFAYAQWPSRESYHKNKQLSQEHQETLIKMRDCVEESFPVILGEVQSDFLISIE